MWYYRHRRSELEIDAPLADSRLAGPGAAKGSDEPAALSAGCRIIHCNAVVMFAKWSDDASES
jgi:hypothetical protein